MDEGKPCPSYIQMGDDYGDNVCTVRCQRVEGHRGKHREYFDHTDQSNQKAVSVIIEWLEQSL